MSRHAQPLCSQQLRVTTGVTRTVTPRVICVFHAPVTVPRSHSERRTVAVQEVSVEKHGTVRPKLRKLHSQLPVAKFAQTPASIEGLESVAVKTLARFT